MTVRRRRMTKKEIMERMEEKGKMSVDEITELLMPIWKL